MFESAAAMWLDTHLAGFDHLFLSIQHFFADHAGGVLTPLMRIITFLGDKWGHLTGKISALNNDKYHILKQRNWRCDIEPARRELGYEPKYTLEQGVPLTIKWYQENGWL